MDKIHYTLKEILTAGKNIIKHERMFDAGNPSVILCSSEFEEAIDRKGFHASECRELVMSQLMEAPDQFPVMSPVERMTQMAMMWMGLLLDQRSSELPPFPHPLLSVKTRCLDYNPCS